MWDNYKRSDIYIIGIPEVEGTETTVEAMITKNFPKLMSDIKSQIQESKRIQSRINAQKTTYKHIRCEHEKIKQKENILKETRGENTLPIEELR